MNNFQYTKYIKQRSDLLSEVIITCKQLLKSSKEADDVRNYIDNRISTYNQNKFDFGYFPPDDNLKLLSDIIEPTKLIKLGLVFFNENVAYKRSMLHQHNLIMPIKDDYGHIVALVGRNSLPPEEQKLLEIQKYKYTYGYSKSCNLFGLYHAKKSIRKLQKVILVEGQIDCISCHAHGLHNTVALGGSSMSDYQLFLLMKYGGNNLKLLLLLDNDEAGKKAENKIKNKYSKYVNIEKINLPPEYKDVDEYLRTNQNYDALL
jgi:DNA primase